MVPRGDSNPLLVVMTQYMMRTTSNPLSRYSWLVASSFSLRHAASVPAEDGLLFARHQGRCFPAVKTGIGGLQRGRVNQALCARFALTHDLDPRVIRPVPCRPQHPLQGLDRAQRDPRLLLGHSQRPDSIHDDARRGRLQGRWAVGPHGGVSGEGV